MQMWINEMLVWLLKPCSCESDLKVCGECGVSLKTLVILLCLHVGHSSMQVSLKTGILILRKNLRNIQSFSK